MLIGKSSGIPSSDITSKKDYLNRRNFMRGAVAAGAAALGAERLANVFSPRTRASGRHPAANCEEPPEHDR